VVPGRSRARPSDGDYTRPVIVVIGTPAYMPGRDGAPGTPTGIASAIACAAAAAGARVEMAARVGDDPAGDALLLALGRARVGHSAMLRDPSRPTAVIEAPAPDGTPLVPLDTGDGAVSTADALADAASTEPSGLDPAASLDAGDLDLALGYLLDARVVVVAQPLSDDAAAAAARRAAFADAVLVAVVGPDEPVPAALDGAIVFERDEGGGDAFATLVGRFAASLDAGTEPAEAFGEARSSLGWSPVTD
jgi:hypothetical protein